jgi:hypothetical protein
MDHHRRIGLCRSLAVVLLFSVGFLTQGSADDSANKPIKALVHGMVNSETYEDLLPHLAITQDDGQQDASKFDVFIFDRTQAEAAQDAVLSTEISKSLYSGHWVLAFDANAKVKTDYFRPVKPQSHSCAAKRRYREGQNQHHLCGRKHPRERWARYRHCDCHVCRRLDP